MIPESRCVKWRETWSYRAMFVFNARFVPLYKVCHHAVTVSPRPATTFPCVTTITFDAVQHEAVLHSKL